MKSNVKLKNFKRNILGSGIKKITMNGKQMKLVSFYPLLSHLVSSIFNRVWYPPQSYTRHLQQEDLSSLLLVQIIWVGYFRVASSLCFKARLSAKPLTLFHKKVFALGLVSKVRVFGTRKWPIWNFLETKDWECHLLDQITCGNIWRCEIFLVSSINWCYFMLTKKSWRIRLK